MSRAFNSSEMLSEGDWCLNFTRPAFGILAHGEKGSWADIGYVEEGKRIQRISRGKTLDD